MEPSIHLSKLTSPMTASLQSSSIIGHSPQIQLASEVRPRHSFISPDLMPQRSYPQYNSRPQAQLFFVDVPSMFFFSAMIFPLTSLEAMVRYQNKGCTTVITIAIGLVLPQKTAQQRLVRNRRRSDIILISGGTIQHHRVTRRRP